MVKYVKLAANAATRTALNDPFVSITYAFGYRTGASPLIIRL